MRAHIIGGKSPKGIINVSGAKNSATRLIAAACISDGEVELKNFPTQLVDAKHKISFLRSLGAIIEANDEQDYLKIDTQHLKYQKLNNYNCPIRTTYLLVAGQIKRSGEARIPYPGGCKIGSRGHDLHIMVWEALGAKVSEESTHIKIVANMFIGAEIHFPILTVGGTENALICGAIAKGNTQIINAYITPEVEDLIKFLRKMGVSISVSKGTVITIHGSERKLKGISYEVMYDRVEALTWLVYAVMSKGTLQINNVPFQAMEEPLRQIRLMGVDFLSDSNSIWYSPKCLIHSHVKSFYLETGTHPGVISDMQPFFTLLGIMAHGESHILDKRYPERIAYVYELQKLLNEQVIEAELGKVVTRGPATFIAGTVTSTDLRGSMALVLAALCAEGHSDIYDVEMALRGYNNLQKKLSTIGISMQVYES